MKPETNNEMDLLLRRLARRDGASVSDVGDHLDADELNAYAENVVPAATRARYTAHLAECTRCRELVVQLSASAGVVIAAETATAARPSVWRTFLASLFTPMVLRYAAPALGLIVVAAIGFVVLRRDRPDDYVTQVTNNEQRPTPLPTAETVSPGLIDPANQSPAAPAPSPEAPIRGQRDNLQAESAPAGNPAPVVSAPVEESKDAAAAQPKVEQQSSTANEPPPAKPAPTAAQSPPAGETEATKKETTITATAAPATENRAFRMQERADRNTNDLSSAANRKAGTADKAQAGTGSVASLQRERMSDRDESAETRSVAGRRFRKRGGVWIDTAYDASRDTMIITRGSEQYRALIADEPEIKTIADQLGGEIVVIWKSRAYRIR